jgi:hypothetical protein
VYTGISELYVRYIAVSQVVYVGENSVGLAFLYRLENPYESSSYHGSFIAITL